MIKPDVAFFDMDHTIIGTDASVSWKRFLADIGLAPAEDREIADNFLKLYHEGQTPVEEFVKFQYCEFIGRTIEEMEPLALRHFEERIRPYIYPDAQAAIDDFGARNIPTVLVTGTNRYIAEPIIRAMKITTLLPTEPEVVDGKFTGGYLEPFLYKHGKLQKAREHCHALQTSMERAAFFADSINDLEMLEIVGYPVAVNPHANLLKEAEARDWPVKRWSL